MLNQALARLLDALHQGVVGGVVAAQFGQIGFDRRGVDVAHQAADVLGLTLERAVGGDFFVRQQRFEQIFGQADFFQRVGR